MDIQSRYKEEIIWEKYKLRKIFDSSQIGFWFFCLDPEMDHLDNKNGWLILGK